MSLLIELLIRAMPYPAQMRDLNIASDYVEFTWCGTRYRVTEPFNVDEVGNGVLIGSDRSTLIRALLGYELARSAN